MSDKSFYLEPVRFFSDSRFLSGRFTGKFRDAIEMVTSLDLAVELENLQDLAKP